MSYTKNTWENGDVITAAKMNNIENGIEAAGSGAYDAILYIYHGPTSSDDYTVTIQSGTYAALKEKVMNNIPPVILCRVWDNLHGVQAVTTAISLYEYPSETYPNKRISFSVKIPTTNTTGTYTSEWLRIMMSWTSTDVVTVW